MTTDRGPCRVCTNSEDWHRHNKTRHQYVPADAQGGLAQLGPRRERVVRDEEGKKIVRRGKVAFDTMSLPSDPVLRIALINKGILTPADLYAAEQELRDAGANSGAVVISSGEQSQGMDDSEDIITGV